ncbi:MFS transporter [Kitasatospora sp. HPMI-4]|uniref:MFS transporter n=1 Tax=Kitasatospora sp. HPMI-4 TaxID=3448443 RepID=UPI003F1B37FC
MRLLHRGPVLLLWGAQMLSVFGDRLYALAVMWIAWEKSGAGAMGLVAVAESVPYIVLGTVGRRVMERFAALRALALVDVVRMVLVAVLPWTWQAFGAVGLLVSAALLGIGGALFDPNLGALVPELVRPEEVQAVNGLMDLTGRVARFAGPGSAGLLLAVMPMTGLFWLDAATFAVSAVALLLLPSARRAARPNQAAVADSRMRPRARVLLRTRPDTAVAIAVHGGGIFAHSVALALPAFLASRLNAGAGAYAAALAATGLGALVGNGFAGNVRLPRNLPGWYCGLWAASGLVLAAISTVRSVPALLGLSVVLGLVNPFLQVALSTHLSSFAPGARLRLMTVDLTVIRTAGTVAMFVIPALAGRAPAVSFLVSGGLLVLIACSGSAGAWWWSRTPVVVPAEPEPVLVAD